MLGTLRIKNLALVSDLTLELEPGLNVITGETGAGKSVIIGALTLLTGQRADRSLIRSGEDSCSVEGTFQVSALRFPLPAFLEEHGLEPCEDGQLVVKRSFTSSGTNRQFVNGSPTTLAVLSQLGEGLVDLHGPHDHQSLLHASRQMAMLDAFGHLEPANQAYAAVLKEWSRLRSNLAELIVDERTYAQQLDLLRFQSQEIAQAKLREDEEVPLQEEFARASNASRLLELSRGAIDLLSEGDPEVLSLGGQIGRTLHECQHLDASVASLVEIHSQAMAQWQELSVSLSRYTDHLDLDPTRLAALEERMNLMQSLKRKYGGSLRDVIDFGNQVAEKLKRLEGREEELIRIRADILKVEDDLWVKGQSISASRKKVAVKLAQSISEELSALGFRQSHFEVSLTQVSRDPFLENPSVLGIDRIEFQFAPNPGEPAKALRSIASSGEMARVMLAIKTVLAAQDDVPVLVFDEVDANVGGETAQVVGQKMAEIAKQRQVLCITHLAPVAASASAHYLVSKEVRGGRTLSEIGRLGRTDRITELARMLGGQSTAARRHAEDLLSR